MIGLAFTLFLLQQPVAVASTTRQTSLAQDPTVVDEAWILRNQGQPAGVYWPAGAWQSQLLDGDGDGLNDLPPGIDGLTWYPRDLATRPTACDFAFSLEGSYLNHLDGDVLRMRPGGGLETLLHEARLADALDLLSGGLDLDAIAWKEPVLWFSLRDGVDSGVFGAIEDGDILRWDSRSGALDRPWTEADLDSMMARIFGKADPIGDVKGLSFDPRTGDLVFTVQSPSDQDASVFTTANGGSVLQGWAEADWGFLTTTEIDALAFLPDGQSLDQPPVVATALPAYAPSQVVSLEIRHGSPGGIVQGLYARRHAFAESPWGQGAIFLDQEDPLYQYRWTHRILRPTTLDAAGQASVDWIAPDLPPGFSGLDFHFQVFDQATARLSPPWCVGIR